MGNSLYLTKEKDTLLNKDVIRIIEDGDKNGLIDSLLNLPGCEIDDMMMEEICVWIVKFESQLKRINFFKNNITSKGAIVLFNTLMKLNSPINQVNLYANKLDEECMHVIGAYIQNSQYLHYLSLGNCNITDNCIMILSDYIVGNTTLINLEIQINPNITEASVPYLVDISKGSHITSISITNTSISIDSREAIENLLHVDVKMRNIPIKSTTKSARKTTNAISQ